MTTGMMMVRLTWKMEFIAEKCHVLETGKIKGLGVIIKDNLSTVNHINNIFRNKRMLRNTNSISLSG